MDYFQIGLGFLCLLVGYLFGSFLFAVILVKLFKGKDIRKMGDKNPGGRNTLESVGFGWGVSAGILDMMKVLGPILLARFVFHLDDAFLFVIALGGIIGHLHPLYFHFKGGRGAAVFIGTCLIFIPWEILGSAGFIFLIYLISKFLLKKPFPISASLIITATIFASLFLDHPGIVKIGLISLLAALTLFNAQNRTKFLMILKKMTGKFKR